MAGEEKRPGVKYSPEIFDKICSQLEDGLSLRTICKNPEMPTRESVRKWLRDNPELVGQYARAKKDGASAIVEEAVEIADDGTNDYMTITKGDVSYNVENREVTSRSKLRVEIRKWYASKLDPKKYQDKVDVTSGNEKISTMSTSELVDTASQLIAEIKQAEKNE